MTAKRPASIKLTYFDFHGGRGIVARVALSVGDIPFTDERVTFADWGALKPKTPLGEMPILEVDGQSITQSNAINRYCGRLAGLYPEDAWQAALCDEPCDMVEALSGAMAPSFSMKGDEQKRERDKLTETVIPKYLKALDAMLSSRGGEWFAAGTLTIADLKVAEIVRMLSAGRLDHIPKEIVDNIAPSLVRHRERVLAHPGVRAYFERFGA